ncbi:hypothetical protein EFA46_015920 (plasmid) [Halarchaeum sp. CBA1220]|uniref:hypothetical protein n=1 Tax=Halarchaeum sp. CBA1220 TaxID=1853682 RepID=UPI001313E093|nr:hypothetical protein [Halarchaeum sp. CBA1220]QLC35745.1 hypothetical protein EFA46_015920 [Halarchaeum sp. CBA1220]
MNSRRAELVDVDETGRSTIEDAAAVINENRGLWERIADVDLPLSPVVQRALEAIGDE